MHLQFVYVVQALTEFDSLFRRNSSINGSLDFSNRSLAPSVNKRCHIKSFPRMGKYLFRDGTGGLSKNVTEDIIQLEVGYGKTVLRTVLLASNHTGELEPVAYQIPQMADVSRRNKGRFDHVTHEEVTDPFGILTVCLVSFLRFGVFGMGKGDKEPCFFQDIENRDPILTGRFHTNFKTAVFCKPVSQFLKPFGEGRETSLLILSSAVCVGNPDAGIDPCFVDIKPTTVFTKDFKSQENNLLRFIVAS